MNFMFFVKVKFLWVIKWPCSLPPFMLTIASRKFDKVRRCWQFAFQHVGFGYMFLDSHSTIHHSNIRDVGAILLFFLIMHLYLISACFSEDERTNIKRHICERNLTNTSNWINYFTLNSEHKCRGGGGDLCSHLQNQQTKSREARYFQSNTCLCIVIDLLSMQQKSCCV